jgi:transposase-like protein
MRDEFNFRLGKSGEDPRCKYWNNIVKQDHRRIESRVQAMLGFKKFYNARIHQNTLVSALRHFKRGLERLDNAANPIILL